MISLILFLIFFSIYIIPVNQVRSAYIGIALIATLGCLEVLGLFGQISVSSNPANTYSLIGVLAITLFASLNKDTQDKSMFLDPLGVFVFLALLEYGLVTALMAFKFALIISLLFSSQKKTKKFYKLVITLMAMLSLSFYLNQLVGPVESKLLEQSLSNLILYKYFNILINFFFAIALLVVGVKSSTHHKEPFAMCLFLLINLYFSQMEIYPSSYYFAFSAILIYALRNQCINLFSTLQVLLTLLFFQLAPEYLVLFSSMFLALELAKKNQVNLINQLGAINSNFLGLGLYLILFSFGTSWDIRISVLFMFLLSAVYIENKEKWVLK